MNSVPALNALLNTMSCILLLAGYFQIKKKKDVFLHKKTMLLALFISVLFLFSYVIYHYNVGSVPYPYHGWTRPVYFSILIPHIIFATLMVPFIVLALWYALRAEYEKHKKVVRWVWPVWIFVSISGVIVYIMLYHF